MKYYKTYYSKIPEVFSEMRDTSSTSSSMEENKKKKKNITIYFV